MKLSIFLLFLTLCPCVMGQEIESVAERTFQKYKTVPDEKQFEVYSWQLAIKQPDKSLVTAIQFENISMDKSTEMFELASFFNLEYLTINGYDKINSFDFLKGLGKLKYLVIKTYPYNDNLIDLKVLKECPNLVYLEIDGYKKIGNPETIALLGELEYLRIQNSDIKSFSKEFGALTKLKSLDLNYNPITSWEGLGMLPQLEKFLLVGTFESAFPKEIEKLVNLKELNLWEFNLDYFNSLSKLTNITKLTITMGKNEQQLTKVPDEFARLTNLNYLFFAQGDDKYLTDISVISKFENLEFLRIHQNAEKLIDVSSMKKLRTLEINDGELLTDISSIRDLPDLEDVKIMNCRKLEMLPETFFSNTNIVSLLFYNTGITTLQSAFNQLKNLKKLSITNCEALVTVPGLSHLLNLVDLDLTRTGIKELSSDFATNANLEALRISYLNGITNIDGILTLNKLKSISYIGSSKSIKRLQPQFDAFKLKYPNARVTIIAA